jgi:hypothetical protein
MEVRQVVGAGDARLPRRAAAERAALGKKAGPCRMVDRTIDAAAAEQRCIRRVDDDIDLHAGDVALLCSDLRHGRPGRCNKGRKTVFPCQFISRHCRITRLA